MNISLLSEVQNLRKQLENKSESKNKNIENIWKHIHFKNSFEINNFYIDASNFQNIEFLGKGCNGLVMKCELP